MSLGTVNFTTDTLQPHIAQHKDSDERKNLIFSLYL